MVGNLVIRGIIVGIVAGLLAFAFAYVFGEPWVDQAISYEEAQGAAEAAAAPAEPEEPALVSRPVQSTFGLMTGLVVVGAGLGGLFAVLFAFANGRMGRLGPQQTSALLALMAFIAVFLVPFLKYPASPPASTDDTTVAFRTSTYLLMLAVSIAGMIGAWLLRQRLTGDYGGWYASLIAYGAYVVVVAVFYLILPNVNETPADFPAAVFYNFRMAAIGIQAVLWATIGLLFGYVVERTMVGYGATATAPQTRRSAMSMR
jgi:predicted cobalt transporter CbtA